MADFPIYRLVKGSQLTFTEMDSNLEWLSRTMSASIVEITGSTFVKGNLTVSNGITGSLFGTSSWAVSASSAVSSSYSYTASSAVSASYSYTASSAVSASYSYTASSAVSASSAPNIYNNNGTLTGERLLNSGGYNLIFTGSNTASSTIARGLYSKHTLVATANNDSLYGLDVTPTYNVASYTGVRKFGIKTTGIFIPSIGNTLQDTPAISVSDGSADFFYVWAGKTGTDKTELFMRGNNPGFGLWYYNIIADYNVTHTAGPYVESMFFKMGSSNTLTLKNSNNVIIGAADDFNYKLDVRGTGRFTSNVNVTGSITATQNITASNALFTGTITAQTLVVQTITSSISYITGSTRFGSLLSDTHVFTGSVNISSSLTVVGDLYATASYALNAISSSYALNAISSSYAATASYALNAANVFPFTGSARITGSLNITGSTLISGSLTAEAILSTQYTYTNWTGADGLYSDRTQMFRNYFSNTFGRIQFNGSINAFGTVSVGLILAGWDNNTNALHIIRDQDAGNNYIYIGSTTTNAHKSASFHVDTPGKGVLLPRMGTAQYTNMSAPPQGLFLYDTGSTTEGFYYFSSGSIKSWTRLVNNTGSQVISGSLTVTEGVTGSLFGTASWAQNSISSSYPIAVTGSSIYSTGPAAGVPTLYSKIGGIFLGLNSGFETIDAAYSIFLGEESGYKASEAYGSAFFLNRAGYSASYANNSFFLGYNAGFSATYANNSNFIGSYAGYQAEYASFSNFIGDSAGEDAHSSSYSNFIGVQAGSDVKSSSYSTLIGYKAGLNNSSTNGIGSNNIIIGTNITLRNNAANSINIGGLLFGTGSYSNIEFNAYSGSANGRIGINQPTPIYNLDVSGSGRYTLGLTVTGSVTATQGFTGSLFGTASQATALQNTGSIGFVSNMSDTYTSTAKITDIITLSAAEYAAIGAPLTSTLYVII